MRILVIVILAIMFTLAGGYYFLVVRPPTVDIESVKNSSIATSSRAAAIFRDVLSDPSATIGSGVAKLAGVDGTSEWKSFRPEKNNSNPDVRCVQVVIKKPSDNGLKEIAKFQFLFNRSSKFIELSYFEAYGTPKTVLEALLTLQYGVIEEPKDTTATESVARLNNNFSQSELQHLKKFGWNGSDVIPPDERYFQILKSRLGSEMGANYDVLLDNITVYSSRVKGNDLIISGNAPHQGGSEGGIIVINLNNGSVSAGLLHAEKYTMFANNAGIVPQIVSDWAAGKYFGD